MNKNKHTPGPWTLMEETWHSEVLSKEGKVILRNDRVKQDATKADARLIAAAPEMLEALNSIRHLINCADFHDENKRSQVWTLVDQVLAKAQGGS